MRSYRFARRSFLAAVGGAFGLESMLNGFEAMAAGVGAPPRFLMTHWPVGTLKWAFLPNDGAKPSGVGSITKYSQILQPFADAGLQNDMTLIWGLRDVGATNGGGGHEAGTPMTTTGADCPGTRSNGGEGDDGVAGGPSWDQILLEKVIDDAATGAVKLKQPGVGYANAICDARIDSQETSTRCLSYGFQTQQTASANKPGTMLTENVPLLPELKPAQLFTKLFSGFMPGGATPGNMEAATKALYGRKSVLDYCLRELDHLKTVAPAAEAQKIDIHADACRKIEMQVSDLLNGKTMTANGCVVPAAPDANLSGKTGSKNDYNNPATSTADDQVHEQIGKIHAGILLAAMQCDIIRVGTFQWSPGTNHVSFKGQYPNQPDTIYMHHPLSHKVNTVNTFDAKPSGENGDIAQFLANVNGWYNARTAMVIKMFKDAIDPLGDGTSTMLDRTVIPYITEVSQQNHNRDPKPAFIFGGKALGMQLGKYVSFEGQSRPHVDLWATVAQAFFRTNNPMASLPGLKFGNNTTPKPIDGLWVKPA